MAASDGAILYSEPDVVTILITASFLLSLNALNRALDRLVYCGLIGQILIGIAFGEPGLQWLSLDFQKVIEQLGYLGLLLLVYEGGLATKLRILRSNLLLSFMIAVTGIITPIALSFVLQSMLHITSLQAFAAGAALSSTSLGTTFTVLQSSGLSQSKLGVVLVGAAMMDDVIGLVLVQIISSLGISTQISATIIVRPVFVSIAYAVVVPLACIYIIRPVASRLQPLAVQSRVATALSHRASIYWLHTSVLVGFVASASYAGTSNLFAAYLAGACVSWWDDCSKSVTGSKVAITGGRDSPQAVADEAVITGDPDSPQAVTDQAARGVRSIQDDTQKTRSKSEKRSTDSVYDHTGLKIYEHYYAAVVNRILRPFFFASIGFSIPITRMFDGQLVWRALIYALLMGIGKLVCGLWLVRFSISMPQLPAAKPMLKAFSSIALHLRHQEQTQGVQDAATAPETVTTSTVTVSSVVARKRHPVISKPQSLYPAAILGSAMVSRGEIGFLISAVAQSSGLLDVTSESTGPDLFLLMTWAIMLCTIIGPIMTGLLTKRVWRLQEAERSKQSGRQDPLGVWVSRRYHDSRLLSCKSP